LCDHIHSITLITAGGDPASGSVAKKRVLLRDSTGADADLFFSTIGGSPGNFGVVTEVVFRAHRDCDFPHARGCQKLYSYNKDALRRLLDLFARYTDEAKLPKAFSVAFSLMDTAETKVPSKIDQQMQRFAHDFYFGDMPLNQRMHCKAFASPILRGHAVLVVSALWADVEHPNRTYEDAPEAQAFFKELHETAAGPNSKSHLEVLEEHIAKVFGGHIFDEGKHTPMSEQVHMFSVPCVREWNLPHFHRFMLSSSYTLQQSKFAETCADRIDVMMKEERFNEFKNSNIFIPLGPTTAIVAKDDGKTAVSFRYSSSTAATTFFFPEAQRALAAKWDEENHQIYITRDKVFSPVDHRFVWCPWESWNMDENWDKFFDSREKYERVLATKRKEDPFDVFTPNLFCVGASTCEKMRRNLEKIEEMEALNGGPSQAYMYPNVPRRQGCRSCITS